MRTLLKQMTQRQHFFGVRSVGPTDHTRDVWINARIVTAIHIGAQFERNFFQQFVQKLRTTGRKRETQQRSAALCETPAVIAERIDPAPLIYQIVVFGKVTDEAQGA